MASAILSSPSPHYCGTAPSRIPYVSCRSPAIVHRTNLQLLLLFPSCLRHRECRGVAAAGGATRESETLVLGSDSLLLREHVTEAELWAAVCLRIRTFYEFNRESCGLENHRRSIADREFEALKDRIYGKMISYRRVACINATVPLSASTDKADELFTSCKFTEDGLERVVIATLDLNQCLWLPDELTGKKPEMDGSDLARAYLSNVCVAKEFQRNGLGYAIVSKSMKVAQQWGITDLYVHVAVDNHPAQKLYQKCGFVYENEEPSWKARFLGRPRRFLLWANLKAE